MEPIKYFAEIISQNNSNPAAISEMTLLKDDTLIRCYVNPWNGTITVLEHLKKTDGNWEELGHTIGSIIVDDDDNIITEIL